MSLQVIKATIECDGCGSQFHVELDAAEYVDGWTLADYADEAVVNGNACPEGQITSVQDGLQLCGACTRVADGIGDENHKPTRSEILEALDAI